MKENAANDFHSLLSFEINKRREELNTDGYKWIKTQVIDEVEKVNS